MYPIRYNCIYDGLSRKDSIGGPITYKYVPRIPLFLQWEYYKHVKGQPTHSAPAPLWTLTLTLNSQHEQVFFNI